MTTAARPTHEQTSTDPAANALTRQRQHKPAPQDLPVQQHNPGEQGINSDQKGPAQPAGNDGAAKGAGT